MSKPTSVPTSVLQKLGSGVALGLLATILWSSGVSPEISWAQTVPPQPAEETSERTLQNPLQQLAPPEVRAFFDNGGSVETAPVYLDGRSLFSVAAPTEGSGLTAARRADEIELRLAQFARELTTGDRLSTLAVTYTLDEESNQPVISVNGEALMTVTFLDGELSGIGNLSLRAEQIVRDLQRGLRRYYQERQPDFVWEQLRWAGGLMLGTLLGSFTLAHYQESLRKKCQPTVRPQVPVAPAPPALAAEAAAAEATMQGLHTQLKAQQRVKQLRGLRQILRFSQVLLWCGSAFWGLGLLPYTRWLQPLLLKSLRVPFRLLLIGLVSYGLIRVADLWIDRLSLALQNQAGMTLERSQRLALRFSTFAQVANGIVTVVVCISALMVMLSQLGIEVAPLVAGAGLVGVAVSFASQSLIKDLINGFLILVEDHYGLGDVIIVGHVSGFVEAMNLRITQLRDTDGQLITIPNGQINIVQNLSKEWSRVDLLIPVSLEADIDQALQMVEQEATKMSQDDTWGALILEPPLLLGVDSLDHVGAMIRIWIKTQPLKQWDVAREYRRRLKVAFEAAHIPLGIPQQIIHVANPAGIPPTRNGPPAGGVGDKTSRVVASP